ncbi:MAG: hypothetical protein HBSAPP03_17680 [Phycisphaerae bacterium]|nr:MAG: hypothetical protein HBSAPP03_17680 [Phycisphaerae bacterium]
MKPNTHARRGFTLIELLVVIAIVAALVAILLPALSSVRSTGRLVVCVSNIRQQGIAIAAYANESRERLPPKYIHLTEYDRDGEIASGPWLINAYMAKWAGEEFPTRFEGWSHPTGMWRCPEVRMEADGERLTHNGVLHHAPNGWLFSSVVENRVNGSLFVSNQAHAGWDQRYAQSDWRRVDSVRRADAVIMLMDNVSSWEAAHNHHDAREFFEAGCEAVKVDNECGTQKIGSHDRLSRRPASFVDGHAAGVPSEGEYWFDEQSMYAPPGQASGPTLWRRDVEHLVWYAEPHSGGGPEEYRTPRRKQPRRP